MLRKDDSVGGRLEKRVGFILEHNPRRIQDKYTSKLVAGGINQVSPESMPRPARSTAPDGRQPHLGACLAGLSIFGWSRASPVGAFVGQLMRRQSLLSCVDCLNLRLRPTSTDCYPPLSKTPCGLDLQVLSHRWLPLLPAMHPRAGRPAPHPTTAHLHCRHLERQYEREEV